MKTLIFHGMRIRIENEAGSVRKGIDEYGKPWETTMAYPYGEIINSMGVDGDPVDCFVGPNKSAKFVFGIHQTKKDGRGFDEQKFMLGFNDAMDAKQAYFKSYDIPEHFYTNIEAISIEVFKNKVHATKNNPQLIHASKMNTAIELYASYLKEEKEKGSLTVLTPEAFNTVVLKPRSMGITNFVATRFLKAEGSSSGGPGIGTPVTVDGFQGRAVIVRINKSKITVKFRSGEYVTRDVRYVHSMNDNYYKSRYSSVR
jgi:hypothetical protein